MRRHVTILFVSFFFLTGCSLSAERLYGEPEPKTYVELGGVPFYPGESPMCAAATLGMVGGYWYKAGEAAKGKPQKEGRSAFEKNRGEIFVSELSAEARKQGLIALESTKKNDLLTFINAGFPVIVRLKGDGDRWRYGVAVGYHLKKQQMILRSCENEREVMPLNDFLKSYRESGYWKLVAVPATMVPPTVGEAQYLKAVHEFELVSKEDDTVQKAYETALTEWPRSLRVLLSVADFYYDKYQYEMAYELYEEILALNPKEPVALTQLAETMYYLGEFEKALEFIDTAIKKNNKLFKEFDGTRKKIFESIESGKIILPNGL